MSLAQITGHTVPGAQRGRALGFPTINFVLDEGVLPAEGVYAVFADGHPAVCHCGPRPTFHENLSTAEVFILDSVLPVIPEGTMIRVDFIHRLRDIQTFSDSDALRLQIEKDVVNAQHFFKGML